MALSSIAFFTNVQDRPKSPLSSGFFFYLHSMKVHPDMGFYRAKPTDKRYSLYDTGGLFLEVMPTGKKFWRLRHSEDGARRKLTLGQYPAVPLSEARAKRDELREAKARGRGLCEARRI